MADSTAVRAAAVVYDYKTLVVPSSGPNVELFARKAKILRLHALQQDPGSFAARYEDELKFSDAAWLERLTRPDAFLLVSIAIPANNPSSSSSSAAAADNAASLEAQLLEHAWASTITLLGPLTKTDYVLPDNGAPAPLDGSREMLWQMSAMYTDAAHRGRGLGKAVVKTAVAFTVEYTAKHLSASGLTEGSQQRQSRVRIFVSPHNLPVLELFGRLGFDRAGMATLAEGLRANGDAVHLPSKDSNEYNSQKFQKRIGYAMEKITFVD